MNKVIAITLYRRPDCAKQVFEDLKQCYSIDEYDVLISCDVADEHKDKCNESIEIAREFEASNCSKSTKIFINEPRLGIDLNKLFIMPKAFEISDFVVFLEDDTQVAKDALRFFEWVNKRFKDDSSIMSATGYNRVIDTERHAWVLENEKYTLGRGQGFSPWGWAMWKDRYEKYIGGTDGEKYREGVGDDANGMFDHWLYATAQDSQEPLWTVYPVMPRTNHVGFEEAEHSPSAEWVREKEWSPLGAWSQEMSDPVDIEWSLLW